MIGSQNKSGIHWGILNNSQAFWQGKWNAVANTPQVLKFREMFTKCGFLPCQNTWTSVRICSVPQVEPAAAPVFLPALRLSAPSISAAAHRHLHRAASSRESQVNHQNQGFSATLKPIHLETALTILASKDTGSIYHYELRTSSIIILL